MLEEAVVKAPIKMGYYGEVGSANAQYRRYLSWFDKQYGKTKQPLAFKEWIEWAKEQELVEGEKKSQEDLMDIKNEEKIETEVKKTGSKIAIAITLIAVLGFGFALAGKN